jgi:hypothetical protein
MELALYVTFCLTFEERRLVLDRAYPHGSLARRLRLAVVEEDRRLRVRCSPELLDELLTFLAVEAGRARHRELGERLGRLYDRLRVHEVSAALVT